MIKSIAEWLIRRPSRVTDKFPRVAQGESLAPIREELFNVERLLQHARSLAAAQEARPRASRGRGLAGRLADNGRVLLQAYKILVGAIEAGKAITPAAEWLVDNYHLVEKQLRELRSDLPDSYYQQLPKLAAGPFVGFPRVYEIAWAFVAHTDSHFESDLLYRYVRAYQEVQPLTIGELWAVSITLRIVLIENLRRLAIQTVVNRLAREQADALADRLLGTAGRPPEPIAAAITAHQRAPLTDAFAVQLAHRLRDEDPTITPALTWLDARLLVQGMTVDAAVREVHRRQGAANVTVRNIITSLRRMADVDWDESFEHTSLVDAALAEGGDFRAMDLATRNLYRSAIETLARGSSQSELEIAQAAVAAARRAAAMSPDGPAAREADCGYHLLNGGRGAFESSIGYRPPVLQRLARLGRALGIRFYVALILAGVIVLLGLALLALTATGLGGGFVALLAILGIAPAFDASIALVNRFVTSGLGATQLPALELRDGVPAHLRTMVAVPMMLTTMPAIEEHVRRLEIHHLASPEGDLHFALLSDWTDAAEEHVDGDEALLHAAIDGIDRLNAQYGPAPGGPRFLLLHRRRLWSPGEACWMGWERKRGKLHELNRLLRGAVDTSFVARDGIAACCPTDIRYVVTLDADTQLPRDTVRRLIGKMAHPLNQPRFDPAQGRVVEGHAVLQPRVTPSMPVGGEGSMFQRIFSSLNGIDPYSAAVSDVYQDLFGEGSYSGKGIYHVDTFEAALAGRVPEGTLLSHDLFEGIFARAGLASDVEVVEEFPSRYDVGAMRHHRWARGDWQLLPWLVGAAPRTGDVSVAAMPAVGRWKMLDNLRRTLSAPLALLALIVGWTLPSDAALTWTVFVVAMIAVPSFIPVLAALPPRRGGVTVASHLRALGADGRMAAALTGLHVTFLAHQAWLMGDAITRTLWRLYVSRRHLLEWTTAAQASAGQRLGLLGMYGTMAGALVLAAIVVVLIASTAAGDDRGGIWLLAGPFVATWLASPIVANWISLAPEQNGRRPVRAAEAQALRLIARRTWRFFETFVTAADNMLPPDNFQEDPRPVLAHRTSPTNMGLYLLSVVCARDFGWIGTGAAVARLETTLATMERLVRHRGHFLNWYDTTTLRPLDPHYVSSVDSGNLAGHLLALASTCSEWRTAASLAGPRLVGVLDAIDILREEAGALQDGRRTQTVTARQLDESLAGLAEAVRSAAVPGAIAMVTLADLARMAETAVDMTRALGLERGNGAGTELLAWAEAVLATIASHRQDLAGGTDAGLDRRLLAVETQARAMALAMEFGFLLDRERKLLSIGYLVPEDVLDTSCYDLLASEARLASFVGIAKGDIPARHWFRLGRAVVPVGHGAALVSWSGSMFEYLMPSLVMRAPAGSLLDQTSLLILRRQVEYAEQQDLPWGISESAYNVRDFEFTYQYSNFGVPSLGLKRGLGENQVVAPYATALAAMVDPHAAAANFSRLAAAGGRGRYGFYEALDYTPQRLPEGQKVAIVRAFMAHHQGMTIVAIADALYDGLMRQRFHAEPLVQATELLLQERMPRDVSVSRPWAAEVRAASAANLGELAGVRRFTSTYQPAPATHLLSNGRFTTMLTAAGSGYSRWGNLAVTRWREDATCDASGSYLFLRDTANGAVWSAGFQPSGVEPDEYNVHFHEDRAEFVRRDGMLTTSLVVLVSEEDDAELRRVTITNAGPRMREIEVTSYVELVLAPQANDIAHPAFSKLFVQTEHLAETGALLATRRRRDPAEPEIWVAHLAVVESEPIGRLEYETDRARFIGRGHDVRAPIALIDGRRLSNTTGTVLDPIFALRRRVRIAPGGVAHVTFWTTAASTRAALLDAIDRHGEATAHARAATLAWTQAQVELHHLGISAGQAALFQRLAGHVIHAQPAMRPSADVIARGAGAQSGLWNQSVSGDLPIVVLRIADTEHLDVAHELLQAHGYWRMKQLAVDVIIINERQSSYVQELQAALETMVRTSRARRDIAGGDPLGRVVVLRVDLMPAETWALLASVARVVLVARRGSLFDQLERRIEVRGALVAAPPQAPVRRALPEPAAPLPKLEFYNGLGGFAQDGQEYVTILGPGQATPAPWINVIANPAFGFQVATEGTGYTWSLSSRENQLTPWSNDPVSDPPGEVIYLRDDDTGELWTPTALPIRDPEATYVAHHGRGYSRFTHASHGIAADLVQFVPVDASIKISRLLLRNLTGAVRHLSIAAYAEWVLGPSRSASLPFVTTQIDRATGAIFARNPWSMGFGTRVAFLDLGGRQTEWTADRREFIGRNASLANPAAMAATRPWSNATGAGLDPCGALRTRIVLPPHGTVEVVCFLGQAGSAEEAASLIATYRAADLEAVRMQAVGQWNTLLDAVQVKTPDRAMDIMLNGWLLYQTLACRIWARAGFYQASGAYGFRDQLQDGMALTALRPAMTREHLLRAAGRQFVEGDVQHWWLPHSGQGVRTRISDDRVWLAYAAGLYVEVSGDAAVFDAQVPFLEGQVLKPGEHDAFFQPTTADETGTLYEHCARALDQSLAVGTHGLPLIGTGDWSDGLNRVGEKGQGESVWLAWLLHTALATFVPVAVARRDLARAAAWQAHAESLRAALEGEAWDGAWYRRGYFDDGTPFGAAASDECRIDALAQSWAVLSGAADPARAATAMNAVERELVRAEDGVALLFTPPFDKTPLDPGYIKGYPPGIRENGGQYTHAALWSVMALAGLGQGDRAMALFALLNPVNHGLTRAAVHRYKVEPYVVAADVYAAPGHMGRGGWTWYTGSAGWMQRAGMESILGLRRRGDELHLNPCIPAAWSGFEVTLCHGAARYIITVENRDGVEQGIASASLDGEALLARPVWLLLVDSDTTHRVVVRMGLQPLVGAGSETCAREA